MHHHHHHRFRTILIRLSIPALCALLAIGPLFDAPVAAAGGQQASPPAAPGAAPPPMPAEAAAVLALPASPGSIARLVEYAMHMPVQTRLREALKDPQPEVRTVAARVAFVTKSMGLLADLQAALDREEDDIAGGEIVRALMTMGGRGRDATALAAARRLGVHTAYAIVETFARAGAHMLLTHLSTLMAADVPGELIGRALVAVTKGDSAARDAVLRDPIVTGHADVVTGIVAALRKEGAPVPVPLLVTYVGAEEWRPRARGAAFLFEKRDKEKEREQTKPPPVFPSDETQARKALPMRTVPPFVGSLWEDLLSVTGCRATDRVAVASVSYHPEGRARSIGPVDTGLTPGCRTAALTLFSLTLAQEPGMAVEGFPELLILPLVPDVIACGSDPNAVARHARRIGDESEPAGPGEIKQPKKLRNVPPRYPESAQVQEAQGIVIVEAMISATGCVSKARIHRSADARLDAASLVAVSQWRYSPTLLRGTPVPVVMTVTVNFTLQP